ncbi:YdeI/OmpD-associated family protein [Sphingobium naphthae]|uniref:YdeI/OmpD-associated family protein n=1 Tax=Sphingobium naphthae TaxID=1886786 RepID=A0ABU3ZSV8_9SPHN|nr:YdeI/OmpD-associated family protein [Sphingobium naphthae]MDV5822609.1 YdeI/OmpD-associated family protein [Sphingobium naphthae]
MVDDFLHGTVHQAADDMKAAISADPAMRALWQRLTPLGRNEFICWVEDAKQPATRARRITRAVEELQEGKKRPCCWAGCIHRADKAPGKWQQAVLIDRKAKGGAGRGR